MPTKKSAPAIEPGAQYAVTLVKAITVGRRTITPGPRVRLRGDLVAQLRRDDPDAIRAFERVESPAGAAK